MIIIYIICFLLGIILFNYINNINSFSISSINIVNPNILSKTIMFKYIRDEKMDLKPCSESPDGRCVLLSIFLYFFYMNLNETQLNDLKQIINEYNVCYTNTKDPLKKGDAAGGGDDTSIYNIIANHFINYKKLLQALYTKLNLIRRDLECCIVLKIAYRKNWHISTNYYSDNILSTVEDAIEYIFIHKLLSGNSGILVSVQHPATAKSPAGGHMILFSKLIFPYMDKMTSRYILPKTEDLNIGDNLFIWSKSQNNWVESKIVRKDLTNIDEFENISSELKESIKMNISKLPSAVVDRSFIVKYNTTDEYKLITNHYNYYNNKEVNGGYKFIDKYTYNCYIDPNEGVISIYEKNIDTFIAKFKDYEFDDGEKLYENLDVITYWEIMSKKIDTPMYILNGTSDYIIPNVNTDPGEFLRNRQDFKRFATMIEAGNSILIFPFDIYPYTYDVSEIFINKNTESDTELETDTAFFIPDLRKPLESCPRYDNAFIDVKLNKRIRLNISELYLKLESLNINRYNKLNKHNKKILLDMLYNYNYENYAGWGREKRYSTDLNIIAKNNINFTLSSGATTRSTRRRAVGKNILIAKLVTKDPDFLLTYNNINKNKELAIWIYNEVNRKDTVEKGISDLENGITDQETNEDITYIINNIIDPENNTGDNKTGHYMIWIGLIKEDIDDSLISMNDMDFYKLLLEEDIIKLNEKLEQTTIEEKIEDIRKDLAMIEKSISELV